MGINFNMGVSLRSALCLALLNRFFYIFFKMNKTEFAGYADGTRFYVNVRTLEYVIKA